MPTARRLSQTLGARTLMSPAESLSLAMRALPGVEQTRSRFGKAGQPAWSVNGREFAHLHADDLLDLRLPLAAQRRLREDPRAHFRSSRSEWLELEFTQSKT